MPSDAFPVSWTECTLTEFSSSCVEYQSTSSLPFVRDSGDLLFLLAFVLFFVSLPGIGMIFTSVFGTNRKL